MIAPAPTSEGTPRLEDLDEPPLHTEQAWALDLSQLCDNYDTIIHTGNPYAGAYRNNRQALERIDVLDLPSELRDELRSAMQQGFNAANLGHQNELSSRLAEHTFAPWLLEELEHTDGDQSEQETFLRMFNERMGNMPVARESTYHQAVRELLGPDAEVSPEQCTVEGVLAASAENTQQLQATKVHARNSFLRQFRALWAHENTTAASA